MLLMMLRLLAMLLITSTGFARAADEPELVSKVAVPAVGDPLPAFESTDETGQPWKSADHIGKKVLVLYLYPGDFTSGCIRQAVAVRDGLAKLEALDIEIVGVSGDSRETHQLFKSTFGIKHTLLADPDGTLAKELGVPVQPGAKVRTRDTEGKPLLDGDRKSIMVIRKSTLPRWTLVIGKDGKLLSKRTQVNPAADAEEVAKFVADATQ